MRYALLDTKRSRQTLFAAFIVILIVLPYRALSQRTNANDVRPPIATPVAGSAAANVEEKVATLLGQMTLDEKLSLLGGVEEFYLRGIERLGIPKLKMGDGPMGVRNWGKSTMYPATILLASTWNEELSARFGRSLGRDSRARGMHVSLAPGVNIYRAPMNGRNFEYMGEDPYLAGRMAVASIKAVQEQGVAATIKHFAANNSETRRSYISNNVDERTLREIYLRPFEYAVKEGNVWTIMNAYNMLNGEHCTENEWLNNTVLKGEWGFRGVVMSDWNATHSTLGAALGGLDLEMPAAKYYKAEQLKPLIESGKVPASVVDDKVKRILRMMVVNGWLGKEQQDRSIPLDDPASSATALQIAREGITLLKNQNGVLPIDRAKARSIVVVGPNADQVVTGLGSSRVVPFHSTSFVRGLRDVAKGVDVHHLEWNEPLEYFDSAMYSGKLTLDLFTSRSQKKRISTTQVDKVDIKWDARKPSLGITADDQPFARYSGEIEVPTSGEFQFVVEAKDTNADVWINGKKIWTSTREAKGSASVPLTAGRKHKIVVEAEQRKKDRTFRFRFGWGEKTPLIPAAQADRIREADLVVVAAGFNVVTGEGEGYDRSYALPGRQEELILEVARLSSKTAVVINAGGSVATERWISDIPVLLHVFYPGQEGGTALAEILLGLVNPSGKLPFSYEKRWEDSAAFGNYPNPDDLSTKEINYSEGIFVGYRWFDKKKIDPLFSFGHGLSYTTFDYKDLSVKKQGKSAFVSLKVTNTGKLAGAETVQLYVGQKDPSAPRPLRELKGFRKISLKPRETTTVSFSLDKDAFSFFHPHKKAWVVEPDIYSIEVGGSSRDIRLKTDFMLNE